MVQLVNHTDVVSVEDLETLISEARHLASEEDASDRLPVVVDEGDLDVELELARAAGDPGSAPAGLERELLADAYRLSHGLDIADSTRDVYLSSSVSGPRHRPRVPSPMNLTHTTTGLGAPGPSS